MSRCLDGIMIAGGVILAAAILAIDARDEDRAGLAAAAGAEPRVVDGGDAALGPALSLRPYLGKPTPPLRLRVVGQPALEAGVPGSIRIEVASSANVSGLALRLQGDGGIEVARPAGLRLPDIARGRAEVVELPLTPVSGGPQRLAGVLEFELDGQRMAMPVSLPLRVAGPVITFPVSSRPEGSPQRDATGELVYPLPAD